MLCVTTSAMGTLRVLPSKLKALTRIRCEIFQTAYNPKNLRTGAKYLRANLRGPAMAQYYPRTINLSQIAREYPELGIVNEYEEQRVQDVEDKKRRGKGTPKKTKDKSTLRPPPLIQFSFSRRGQSESGQEAVEYSGWNAFISIITRRKSLISRKQATGTKRYCTYHTYKFKLVIPLHLHTSTALTSIHYISHKLLPD